jgi:hypothetical protein
VGLALFAEIGDQENNFEQTVEAFCLAETSTNSVSPPHSAGMRPRLSWRFTRSTCASGLSIVDGHDHGDIGGFSVVDGFPWFA